MNMKSRKVISYFISISAFIGAFVLTVLKAQDSLNIIGVSLIGAYTFVNMVFVGGVVFEKYLKYKYRGE